MTSKNIREKTTLKINSAYLGEPLEDKIERMINNGEPIGDQVETSYSERKDGVKEETNIRTDRFEVAVDQMDKVHKSMTAKRNKNLGEEAKEGMKKEGEMEAKGQSSGGTNSEN